jgi:hypothetical protein|tara:strand:- start:545 stop:793 length:249 start_codon:yes stop_codon:yes gene_type:complete
MSLNTQTLLNNWRKNNNTIKPYSQTNVIMELETELATLKQQLKNQEHKHAFDYHKDRKQRKWVSNNFKELFAEINKHVNKVN